MRVGTAGAARGSGLGAGGVVASGGLISKHLARAAAQRCKCCRLPTPRQMTSMVQAMAHITRADRPNGWLERTVAMALSLLFADKRSWPCFARRSGPSCPPPSAHPSKAYTYTHCTSPGRLTRRPAVRTGQEPLFGARDARRVWDDIRARCTDLAASAFLTVAHVREQGAQRAHVRLAIILIDLALPGDVQAI